jgi:membrane-associated phospholipid phosphatase
MLVLIFPLWMLDKPFYDLRIDAQKIRLLGDIRDVTRQFGEPVGIMWIGAVLWSLDRSRRRPLVIALVATLIASGLGSGTKLLIGRERPKVSGGSTVLQGPHLPGTMKPDPSFPSGHTTVAFAFAYGLSRLYKPHRKLWLALAAGCGVSRACGEAHFLTDVLVGAWLGWEVAALSWSWPIGPVLMARLDRRISVRSWFPRWDWKLAE